MQSRQLESALATNSADDTEVVPCSLSLSHKSSAPTSSALLSSARLSSAPNSRPNCRVTNIEFRFRTDSFRKFRSATGWPGIPTCWEKSGIKLCPYQERPVLICSHFWTVVLPKVSVFRRVSSSASPCIQINEAEICRNLPLTLPDWESFVGVVHFKQVGSVWNVCSGTFLLARHLFLRKALGTWQQLEPPEYFTDKNYHSEASIGDQGAYTRFLRVSPSADVCHSKILPRYIFAESQILRGTGDLVCICQIVTLTTAFHNKLRFVMVRFVAFCCLGAPSWL